MVDQGDSHFFFSLQFSAIQKIILRHDRLWSMAGISHRLSRLNEIELADKAREHDGVPLVAGGGKFTACFRGRGAAENAEAARAACLKTLSTTFPMLEYQAADVVPAGSLNEALYGPPSAREDDPPGLVPRLNAAKRRFRGYGVTFNPHLMVCGECGEYPAQHEFKRRSADGGESVQQLCRVCSNAYGDARVKLDAAGNGSRRTTVEQIYDRYLDAFPDRRGAFEVPLNFENLFSPDGSRPSADERERRRMAVWFADINHMGRKVGIWLKQPEDQILPTFQKVGEVFIQIVAEALQETFRNPQRGCLPFRIIIAGGDDLCIVMAESRIIDFTWNLSDILEKRFAELKPDHPLSPDWLERQWKALGGGSGDPDGADPTLPYCFGGAFVIAGVHTPFRKIHAVGEELMKAAKTDTGRRRNSVNWRIMAETQSQADRLFDFEKPLFIGDGDDPAGWDRLSFKDYLKLAGNLRGISSSHQFQIIDRLIRHRHQPRTFERWLTGHAASGEKSFSGLLKNPELKVDGVLSGRRIITLFELMSIKTGGSHE